MMGERLKLNVRIDRFAMRHRLERDLMRIYFGSEAAPWDSTRDEQVFAHDPMQDAPLFATLPVHLVGSKLMQLR